MSDPGKMLSGEDYEQVLNDAIARDRAILAAGSGSIAPSTRDTFARAPSPVMTEFINTGVDWQAERVDSFRRNYTIRDLDNAITEYRTRVEQARPAESYGSRIKEIRAWNEYRPILQWFANLLATRIVIDEFDTLRCQGRLRSVSPVEPARSLDELSKSYQASEAKSKAEKKRIAAEKSAQAVQQTPESGLRRRRVISRETRLFPRQGAYRDGHGVLRKVPRTVIATDTLHAVGTRPPPAPSSTRPPREQGGHWEFLSHGGQGSGSEQEFAQVQLRGNEYVGHGGPVTAEDVRRVQLSYPGLWDGAVDDIELVWVPNKAAE